MKAIDKLKILFKQYNRIRNINNSIFGVLIWMAVLVGLYYTITSDAFFEAFVFACGVIFIVAAIYLGTDTLIKTRYYAVKDFDESIFEAYDKYVLEVEKNDPVSTEINKIKNSIRLSNQNQQVDLIDLENHLNKLFTKGGLKQLYNFLEKVEIINELNEEV